MRCEKCDHDNDAGASMCAGCGVYLSAPEPVDTRPPLSEFAESALTLAAISPLLLGLTALLALPVGVVGLVEVRRSRGRLRGTGHAIAAIVIGGASINGGRGTVTGTFMGVLFIGMLNNSMSLLNIDSVWQLVYKGVVILAALVINWLLWESRNDESK